MRKQDLFVIFVTFLFIVFCVPFLSFASESLNGADDTHIEKNKQKGVSTLTEYLADGTPNCVFCHTADRKPAIDYTHDPECLQCHSADYSERFLDIDMRYKVPVEEVNKRYRELAVKEPVIIAKADSSAIASAKKYKVPEEMIFIPAGEFIMGTDDWWPKSGPAHKRSLPDYFIDRYETTNAEYMKFVKANDRPMPDNWMENKGNIPDNKEDHPVTYVSWFDAQEYCKWRGKRLLTEPEWEKAARGVEAFAFPWGNEFEKNKANTPQLGVGDTMPVGSFEDGKSPYGVYDMAGNVFEWVEDWYMAYPGNTHSDPNEGKRYRVVRGGSWYDCTYYKCGISAPAYNRIFFNPFTKNNNFGFRCAKNP